MMSPFSESLQLKSTNQIAPLPVQWSNLIPFLFLQLSFSSFLLNIRREYTPSRLSTRIAHLKFAKFFHPMIVTFFFLISYQPSFLGAVLGVVLGHFCTDLAAHDPYHQHLGPISSSTALALGLIRYQHLQGLR